MSHTINLSTLNAFKATAANAAGYLDACDLGLAGEKFDPDYYRACGHLLSKVFMLFDPERHFQDLLAESPAAREMAESLIIAHRIELSRVGFYPELAVLMQRAAA